MYFKERERKRKTLCPLTPQIPEQPQLVQAKARSQICIQSQAPASAPAAFQGALQHMCTLHTVA